MLNTPVKYLLQLLVLLGQGYIGNWAGVGVDTDRHASPVQTIDRVVGTGFVAICLHITGGAGFEMDLFILHPFEQCRISDAANAMTSVFGAKACSVSQKF